MEFKFELGDANIIAELAMALYKDNSICIAHAGNPLDMGAAAEVLGEAINSTMAHKTEMSWVERRDTIHKISRAFTTAMQAAPEDSIWRKASEEVPSTRSVMFTAKESPREIRTGVYDAKAKTFASHFKTFDVAEVLYWAPVLKAPISSDEAFDDMA